MYVRCPHCRIANEAAGSVAWADFRCVGCGQRLTLLGEETVEFKAGASKQQLGHFELIRKIGSGSFGTVWQARDLELDRAVAIKIPHQVEMSPRETEKFLREARAAAQLQHPNLIPVHEIGRVGCTIYIASDFVEGITLADWLTGNQPTPPACADLCRKLALALHHAHDAGVIHRDLKPSNIIMDSEWEPHVTDFGLAKREEAEATMTRDGDVIGTPAYMSPEQARGNSHNVDRRTDVYSLGVILFQMLTGERPFRGSPRMILHQVLYEDVPSPRKLNHRVPEDLDTICMKCLEKSLDRRYLSAAAVAEELGRFLEHRAILARPISPLRRTARWARRNPIVSLLSACLLLSLLLGLGGVTGQWFRAQELATVADVAASRAKREATAAKEAANRESVLRQRTERYLYIADMNMVQQAYEFTDPDRVVRMLARYRPESKEVTDLRSFEWYYWRQQSCRWDRNLVGHQGPVYAVAFSPSGGRLVTAGADQIVRVWDVTSGDLKHDLASHVGDVFALAFSPTGEKVVSAGADSTLRVWNVERGELLAKLTGHHGSIFSLAFSRDGSQIVSAGSDRVIRVWDLKTGTEETTFMGHLDFVYSVALSHDGTRVASAGLDRTIRLWNLASGSCEGVFRGHDLEVWSVAFSPDDEFVASGSGDKTVKLWDRLTGKAVATLEGHQDRVRCVCFQGDGTLLISASQDRTICPWDLTVNEEPLAVPIRNIERAPEYFFERMQLPANGRIKATLKGHVGSVNHVAVCNDGATHASASEDGTVKLWKAGELTPHNVVRVHHATVNSLVFSPDDSELISGSNDRTLRVIDVAGRHEVCEPREHGRIVLCVARSPDGQQIASGGVGNVIRIWQKNVLKPVELRGHSGPIASMAFSSNGKKLASASHDGTVKIWDISLAQQVVSIDAHENRSQAVVYLKHNKRIATAGGDGLIKIWSSTTGEQLASFAGHKSKVWCLAISADGTRLASASADRTVRLWDIGKGAELLALRGHADTVHCVTFAPDGKTLASGSADKTVKLWDTETGEPKATLVGHEHRVWAVAFSSDQQVLASASYEIRLWEGARRGAADFVEPSAQRDAFSLRR